MIEDNFFSTLKVYSCKFWMTLDTNNENFIFAARGPESLLLGHTRLHHVGRTTWKPWKQKYLEHRCQHQPVIIAHWNWWCCLFLYKDNSVPEAGPMGQTIPHYLPHNSQLSPWLMLCLNIINILTRRKIIQFVISYYIGPDPSYARRT